MKKLNVFFTVDVEVWCDGWKNIDDKFPAAFQRYVYGKTPTGDYGLVYQLKLLQEHGLTGVFFVEPLFSCRFGIEPLQEIVTLIKEHDQEVQLHLHPEWVDEARVPLLADSTRKRQFLRYYSEEEQITLINTGKELVEKAGNLKINAFRAGGFGFNANSLSALKACGIPFDCSYNATVMGPTSGVSSGVLASDVFQEQGIFEYPMTVYQDRPGNLRHAQLGACSTGELESLMWKAANEERKSFMMLSHNFELLNRTLTKADPIVISRFVKLCRFLDKYRDTFETRGFLGIKPDPCIAQPSHLKSNVWRTASRTLEQLYRRKYA